MENYQGPVKNSGEMPTVRDKSRKNAGHQREIQKHCRTSPKHPRQSPKSKHRVYLFKYQILPAGIFYSSCVSVSISGSMDTLSNTQCVRYYWWRTPGRCHECYWCLQDVLLGRCLQVVGRSVFKLFLDFVPLEAMGSRVHWFLRGARKCLAII